MKLTSLLRLLTLALAASSLATAQDKAAPVIAFGIAGTLISGENGAPVPHGHLSATLVPQDRRATRRRPAPIGTFDADENGRFSIPLPSAGMWRVAASARGYVTQAYEEHESFSSGVVLTNDSPEMHLRFRISPEAVITGTVLDEAGEPVRDARLTLLALHALGPDSIQLPARTRASVVTDDRGYYEFDGLLPGDYR
ncbi:MAG: carboxypeptidase-like regulatory domain-containing protein, partial [Edaphobacter sp.]